MNLVTTYFTVKRIATSHFIGEQSLKHRHLRQLEYVDCLVHNALHPAVESIVLLVEGVEEYAHLFHTLVRPWLPGSAAGGVPAAPSYTFPSIFQRRHLRKLLPLLYSPSPRFNRTGLPMPVYADLFHIANQLLPGKLVMICNADVHLSHTHFDLEAVQRCFAEEGGSRPKAALALTRYEGEGEGEGEGDDADGLARAPLIRNYRGSHDAFVFRAPVLEGVLPGVTHPQNCYQAENIVIHELRSHNYTVLNPCLDLRLIHRHAADVRQWLPSVDPERYGLAPPITIAECLQQLQARGSSRVEGP